MGNTVITPVVNKLFGPSNEDLVSSLHTSQSEKLSTSTTISSSPTRIIKNEQRTIPNGTLDFTQYKFNDLILPVNCMGGKTKRVFSVNDMYIAKVYYLKNEPIVDIDDPYFKYTKRREELFVKINEYMVLVHSNIIKYVHVSDLSDSFLGYVTLKYDKSVYKLIKNNLISNKYKKIILEKTLDGISFLHNKNIVHYKFCWRNVMISSKRDELKIIDVFDYLTMQEYYNMFIYQPPESLCIVNDNDDPKYNNKYRKITKMSNVYAFGIMIYQLLHNTVVVNFGDENETNLSNSLRLKFIHQNNKKPIIDDNVLHNNDFEDWIKVMTMCWETDPEKRPSFEQIIKIIKKN